MKRNVFYAVAKITNCLVVQATFQKNVVVTKIPINLKYYFILGPDLS